MRRWSLAAFMALLVTTGCASTLERAQSAHRRGDYDEAELLYRRAAENDDSRDAADEGIASMWAEQAGSIEDSDPDGAEDLYRDALDLRPGHDESLTGLVRLLRKQKRFADASGVLDEAEASGKCGGSCGRLTLVLLLDQGDRALAKGQWDEALAAYEEAQRIREQPTTAIAIAATLLEAGDLARTEAALVAAHPLMLGADASTTERFLQIQSTLIDRLLETKQLDAVDRVRALRIREEPPDRATTLALQVADTLHEAEDEAGALARYEQILATPDEHPLDDAQRAALSKKAAFIYAALGTRDLHDGFAGDAEANLRQAIALRPEDWSLKLQRLLALSGSTGAAPALEGLSKVPTKAAGVTQVRAILLALRAREEVGRGELETARATLEQAQQAYADLPEVHLAAALILARSPSDELGRGERRVLQGRTSIIPYGGEVFRWGEALSELDWVRNHVASRSKTYPFTAPWLASATKELEDQLRSVYPLPVSFREEPEPIVVFDNTSARAIEVSVSGPEGLREELFVAAGAERELMIPDSGLLRLRVGRTKRVFYAEGYAKVTLTVP